MMQHPYKLALKTYAWLEIQTNLNMHARAKLTQEMVYVI